MDRPHLFTPACVDGHLGGFHLLEIVSEAAMNMSVHISVQVFDFNPFGYITLENFKLKNGFFFRL